MNDTSISHRLRWCLAIACGARFRVRALFFTAALVAAAAPATGVRAQSESAFDPAARYQRPAAASRRGEEPELQAPSREAIEPPPALVAPPVVVAPQAPVRSPGVDRRDKRTQRLAVPDEYLDPAFPDAASRIAPEQSDNVEEVPLEDQALDDAEREEAERYKEALGHYKDPDELTQDNWGRNPGDGARESDVEEYEDPAEW